MAHIIRKLSGLALVVAMAVTFTSCVALQSSMNTPVPAAGIYTGVKGPVTATSNNVGSKVGQGEASNILGLIATGDASINTAANSAGISEISHVDYETTSILGIYSSYTIYVYGN